MNDVELIKSKIDIVDYLSGFITLKKAGRNFKALCPFHSEKTPSFVISAERQSWHCFGACGEGGDVITFLQKWENLEFVEALKILAEKTGVTLSNQSSSDSSQIKEKLYAINHLASEFFNYLLTSHKLGKRAMEYLKKRGIKEATIKTFSLGYAPESWDSLYKFLSKKGHTTTDIATAGLLVKTDKGNYYDRFRGRLIFTLRDQRGNIVGFSGRKLPGEEEKQAKYINTSETPVYIKGNVLYGLDVTRNAIKEQSKAVVVEGEFDMLSSFQNGVANVVAIKGSALTEGQVLLIRRYTENVALALDSDFAGNEAARRGIEIAESSGLLLKVVQLPYGKDPFECIEKSSHLWKDAVDNAIPVYDFVIKNALSKYDKNDVSGKRKIGNEIVPFLAKINNPIIQSHYVKFAARELMVNEESIISLISQQIKKGKINEIKVETLVKTNREELLEEHLLSLIIQSENPKEVFTQVFSELKIDDFVIPPIRKIMDNLTVYFKKQEKFEIKEFTEILTPEVLPAFDRCFMTDISVILQDKKHFDKEMSNVIFDIKKIALRRKVNDLATKIRKMELEGKEDEADTLHEQQRQILILLCDLEKAGLSR